MVITRKVARTSSKQATDYLLCSDCEELFSKHGESWMSQNGVDSNGNFKLQELLKAATPLATIQNARLISGKRALQAEGEKLVYFATSVFWRAAAHSWKLERHDLERINLGKYEDDFRRYLLGETGFPETAVLWCHVAPSQAPMGGLVAPYLKNKSTYYQFHFAMTGVAFDLFVGRMIPEAIRQTCLHTSAEQVIFLSDVVEPSLISSLTDLHPKG